MSKENIIKQLLLIARCLLGYVLIGIIGLIFFTPCLVLVCLPPRYRYANRLLFWLLNKAYKGVCASLMMPITVQGREHLPIKPALFVANHQSALDIPLLGMLMNGHPHLWYVLAYYKDTFILGFFVRRLGIFIDPKNPPDIAKSLLRGMRIVKQAGSHTIVFPEGARFIDGYVHPFLPGFSLIARKLAQPVIPVFLHNAGAVYPPGAFLAHPHPLSVIIGPSFHFLETDTLESFTGRVHAWFDAQQQKMGRDAYASTLHQSPP